MDVSIIIVNYNTKDLIKNCIDSIYEQTKDIKFEIIVSDNGSVDGSIEMIKSEFPNVILIENNANLGFGTANNRGLKIAKGKYIFYLNSDTVLLNNAVKLYPDNKAFIIKEKKGKDIKILYGIELNVAPRTLDIVKNPTNIDLKDATYVFFDLETSGLSPVFDDIIEFGAVKAKNGMELDRIDILINPGHKISKFTEGLTGITNEMLADKPTLNEVLPKILEFLGDDILVAHNASFDVGFLQHAIQGKLKNPIIDTLPLCRYLFQNEKRYSLGNLCRSKGIDYDEANDKITGLF